MGSGRFSYPSRHQHFGGWLTPCWRREGAVLCIAGGFAGLPGLYPQDVSSASPMHKTNVSPDMAKGPMWGKIIPS